MSFSFGFSGDDVEDEELVEASNGPQNESQSGNSASVPEIPVQEHQLAEMLATLPDRISYSTISIESPLGRKLLLPKRELYDVRVQLMAEGSATDEQVLADIEKSDIRSGVYEGGFKTWECSLDLASLLLDRGPRKDIDELVRCDQIIELGAGSALPTLVLFQHALTNTIPLTFTLSDYNAPVLALLTLPNLLLTWAAYTSNPSLDLQTHPEGDLEITPELLHTFTQTLHSQALNLSFLSGPWAPPSRYLRALTPSAPDMGTVVLAAETIYSEQATRDFVDLLIPLLQRAKMSKAIVAAKKIYFGVGGSVDGLKRACAERGAVAYEVENSGVNGLEQGVGRSLVEVQMY